VNAVTADSVVCVSQCVVVMVLQRRGYQQLAVKCDSCGLLVLDVVSHCLSSLGLLKPIFCATVTGLVKPVYHIAT